MAKRVSLTAINGAPTGLIGVMSGDLPAVSAWEITKEARITTGRLLLLYHRYDRCLLASFRLVRPTMIFPGKHIDAFLRVGSKAFQSGAEWVASQGLDPSGLIALAGRLAPR